MKHISAIQSQLAINRRIISMIEEDIVQSKSAKYKCDEAGWLAGEYSLHNSLKKLRAELKAYVKIQKTLKQIIKDLK